MINLYLGITLFLIGLLILTLLVLYLSYTVNVYLFIALVGIILMIIGATLVEERTIGG